MAITKRRSISLRKALLIVGLVGVLGVTIGYNTAIAHFHNSASISAASEKPLIDYINTVRAEQQVGLLHEDKGLDETAKLKAEDMAARNYFEHTNPDGQLFYFIMQQQRPGLKLYGENLAECYGSYPETVDAWVKSPGHFANMINARYNIYGTYTLWDSDKNCMITVNHFGQE